MISIHPHINVSPQCPVDGTILTVETVIIPGMHCLVDAVCSTCGDRFLAHLPTNHALQRSVLLNQTTATLYGALDAPWLGNPLRNGFLHPNPTTVIPVVHRFAETRQVILINCLDFLYGHSLLALLNVQRCLEQFPQLGCCVLVPSQLKHLVPDGVAEIWEVPVAIKDGSQWYPTLARWIRDRLLQYETVFLYPVQPHPAPQTYDLHRFVRNLPELAESLKAHHPVILFSYREDRLWGRSLSHQQRNLQKLYNRLSRIFPTMAFVLVGFGQHNVIQARQTALIDLRTDAFDERCDRLWMAYMQIADCAIGVHGSNMLLPSGLAKSTIELVPSSRLPNTVQAFLFPEHCLTVQDGLLFYRIIYGNDTLSNVQPSSIINIVATLLSTAIKNSALFKGEPPFNIENVVFEQALNAWKHQIKHPWIKRKMITIATDLTNRLLEVID